jgi:HEAT repeat protein
MDVMDSTLSPDRILSLLAEPVPEGAEDLDLFDRLLADAPSQSLIGALRRATDPDDRRMLCDLLGFRASKAAVPVLIECLADPVSGVRGSAADALGKAFGYVAGPPPPARRKKEALDALLARWRVEESAGVRSTIAQTLGLVGDPSVRPLLEEARGDADPRVRRQAEWALDYLSRKTRT